MGSESGVLIVGGVTLLLCCVVLALAIAGLAARALFVACVCCVLMAAITGLIMAANGDVLAAIGFVVFGVAVFPAWLLGGMLLSTNAAKDTRRGTPWLTLATAIVTAALIVVVTPELTTTSSASIADTEGLSALLAAIMFVAGVCVIGLIGYGERGAFERRERNAP